MPSRRAVLTTLGMCTCGGCLTGVRGERCIVVDSIDDADPVAYVADNIELRGSNEELVVADNAPEPVVIDDRLREGYLFQHDDVIYRIETVESVTVTQTRVQVMISREPGESRTSADPVDSLPSPDRSRLEPVLADRFEKTPEATESEMSSDATASISVDLSYDDAPFEDSRFASTDTLRVAWNDQIYAVEVQDRQSETVERWRHRATIVAASETELREHLETEHLVSFDDIADEERGILETALTDEYRRCVDRTAEFADDEQRLLSRLSDAKAVPVGEPTVYVALDGERHLVTHEVERSVGEW